ncbi:MAG: hypothetical protein ACI9J2_002289 [Saprospiraceae bacterium]
MKLTIKYWRDIPSMVSIKQGRKRVKTLLSERFQEAIDSAAMRGKAVDTDTYLEDWRDIDKQVDDGDLQQAVDAAALEIENSFDAERLAIIIKNQGHES